MNENYIPDDDVIEEMLHTKLTEEKKEELARMRQQRQMSDYTLNSEAKPFSYTREELFNVIAKIVAHSSSVEAKSLAIMMVFEDYFSNYTESDNNGGYCVYERDEFDFEDFVRYKLNLEYYHPVDADELLK